MTELLNPPGEKITQERLRAPKAHSLADALNRGDISHASLIECRALSDADIVIMDLAVEVSQLPVYPINPSERVAVVFVLNDEMIPEVLSLRLDFPKVPHLNLKDQEFPRSLCLYEEAYRDLKRHWTAPRFVDRIREWLTLTAKGELHQENQSLEPFLSGHVGHIILPHDLINLKEEGLPKRLYLTATDTTRFIVAHTEKPESRNSIPFAASVHLCPAQEHGIIRRRPLTLDELSFTFSEIGFDILSELRERLRTWLEENALTDEVLNSPIVLVFVCPKIRKKEREPESADIWTFITSDTVCAVGEKIGLWHRSSGHIGLLIPIDIGKKGNDVRLDLLNSSVELTRNLAAKLNNQTEITTLSITAIGVGALGSQIVMNLARSGFGNWTLADNDRLMPHNITRHALGFFDIGYLKAEALSSEANQLIRDAELFTHIPVDVMNPDKHAEQIIAVFKQSDIILDMSVSITIARYIALNIESSARRVSLFMTPTGDDLVLLAEDSNRSLRLDELEMQYYRAIIREESLHGHLKPPKDRRRYGQSCRDITSTLPQNLVALHAAIGARALCGVVTSEQARIIIWRCDTLGNVKRIDIPTVPVFRHQIGEWTICVDEHLLYKLSRLRTERLPNETGGVLLGTFDLERKIIYLVETIPSPSDSLEWPTLYIRGSQGLAQKVEKITRDTSNMLEYIGDWHSHPNGFSTAPSYDDLQVFSWLSNLMKRDGLPALMLIVGEAGGISCFVSQIDSKENLLPTLMTQTRNREN